MIRRVSITLTLLLVVGVGFPLDNHFSGGIIIADTAAARVLLDPEASENASETPAENDGGRNSHDVEADDGRITGDTPIMDLTMDPVNDAPAIPAKAAFIEHHLKIDPMIQAFSETVPAEPAGTQAPATGTLDEKSLAVVQGVFQGTANKTPTANINVFPAVIEPGESALLTWNALYVHTARIDQGLGLVNSNGSISVAPDRTTTYTINAAGAGGLASAKVTVKVLGRPNPQPPGHFGSRYEDLVPPDATLDRYDPKRFSLVTGLVHDLNHEPLVDVSVTIHDRPEYGTTASDSHGRFTIPVEGGSTLTVVFEKEGLITAHRQVYVPWNNIAIAETVQLIAPDPASTTLAFDGNPATVVTHRSTRITDEFGSRSATLVFSGDNRAFLMDENGHDVQELAAITTRATEFTTAASLPADLPPNAAYTYCVELSVDGAQGVRFDKPVIAWIDNFFGFDVGTAVPVGHYDRGRGRWKPADNGKVVRLLDTDSDGIPDALDADGDDQPDDLNSDGSFSDEVLGLENPRRYPPGLTFWRVAVSHFAPWDCSRPYGSPPDAIASNADGIPSLDGQPRFDGQDEIAAYAEAASRIFHKDIPIPGTDISLHYASGRVKGYRQVISVPASGDEVPVSLERIIARVEVAGRSFEQLVDPSPYQVAEIVWDGRDHLGRPVHSPIDARVSVGFVYKAVYLAPGGFARAFGQAGTDSTDISARRETIFWRRSQLNIAPEARQGNFLAEGWTVSNHHHIAPSRPWLLFKGDGTTSSEGLPRITTIAGSGSNGYSGDGEAAAAAELSYPAGVAVDAAGNLFIAEWNNHCVRKVDTSGVITTVAGIGSSGYSGDGGPASAARLNFPYGVAVDAAGNVFIADGGNHRIRKVDATGIIATVAGSGSYGFSGDGGPAIAARLNYPSRIALDGAGNLYIVDRSNHRIRKVDSNGTITTVVGNGFGGQEAGGHGMPAVAAGLGNPLGLAVDVAGNIYISDWADNRIYKVDTSGLISTIAGSGVRGYGGDGSLATMAWLNNPFGVAVDAAGAVYIADSSNYRIRKVNSSGFITTVAGSGAAGYSGDGGRATAARLKNPYDVTVDAVGNLYIADHFNQCIRKVAPAAGIAAELSPGEIALAENSGLGHIFSSTGLHQRTFDLDTGVIMRSFSYDEDSRLQAIEDQFGNTIRIERDPDSRVPTAVISPQGVRTGLTVDAGNHLTHITYPDENYYSFEYSPEGLMTAETEPAGKRFEHGFSQSGRLTDVFDEQNGHWNYQRTASANGEILTRRTSGEGNVTSSRDHTDATGADTSIITGSAGSQTMISRSAGGLYSSTSAACGMDQAFKYDADAQYGFQVLKQLTETSPAGLARVVQRDKAYQDTDADDIPDVVTVTFASNGNTTTHAHYIPAAEKVATSPEGRTVTSLYDPDTLLTDSVMIPGLYDTDYEYDAAGRVTLVSRHTRQTAFAYNPAGWLESITDSENRTTGYSYDALGRVIEISRPDGSYIDFDYDASGNLTELINPAGIAHGFGYNRVNRPVSYQTPLSGSYRHVYDKDRRLIQTGFPSGKTIVRDYADPANPADKSRLRQIVTPHGNIDFSYRCGSQVESVSKGPESIVYSYDGDLVISETFSGTLNQSLFYTYNNDFNVAEMTYAGVTAGYSYDNDGLLTDAGSFTIWRNIDNGLAESVTGSVLELSRTFNGYAEVDAQAMAVNGRDIASWSLTRENNGRIASKTETLNHVTVDFEYTYDAVGRLLTVVQDGTLVEEYRYKFNGARKYEMNALRGFAGRSYSYSDEDHLLTAGSVSYDYDPDGYLASKTDGNEVTSYSYASRGELLQVILPDGRVIEYGHDPLARRIAKKIDGVVVEKYLWQGLTKLLAVYDGAGNLLMRFEYADGRLPVAVNAGGATYYLAFDQVGSLRSVSDFTGNVVKSLAYDSFGSILSDSNPAFAMPLGFSGGLHDRDTGLVRFAYRDYDPDVGRWTAKDPIGFAGSDTDLYGYASNDPINLANSLGSLWDNLGSMDAATCPDGPLAGFGDDLKRSSCPLSASQTLPGLRACPIGPSEDNSKNPVPSYFTPNRPPRQAELVAARLKGGDHLPSPGGRDRGIKRYESFNP